MLSAFPRIQKDGFVIMSADCTGSMFQAICTSAGKRRQYYAEWQLFGMSWQFGRERISEKRLLELCRLFLDGGLAAVENEEPWKQVKMKGSY